MAGRDERRGGDLDDWFDEPQPPRGRRARPGDRGNRVDAPAPGEDDWLDEDDGRLSRIPRPGFLDKLPDPRAIVVVAVAAIVLLLVGLAVGGVFSSSPPATTAIIPTHAVTTTASTTQTTTSATPLPAPTVPLKPGDTGPQVRILQRALASLGFSSGTIDGNYGPSTQDAVSRFQRSVGITADGVVGPETRQALRTALAK
jgi:Putative peptidoglycan binding domain